MTLCQVCGRPNGEDAKFCFSCGTALSQAPPVKVEIKSPLGFATTSAPVAPPTYAPRQGLRQWTCYYHPELPSMFICSRCGRSICAGCGKQYGVLTFCPECFHGLAAKIGYGQYQYGYQYPVVYEQPGQGRPLF